MAKRETMYDVVFRIYHLQYASKESKEKIRRFLNRQLIKYYNKPWNELSNKEKDIFVYIDIQERMLNSYANTSTNSNLKKEINSYIKQQLILSDAPIQEYIDSNKRLFDKPDLNGKSNSEIQKIYEQLCSTLQKINKNIPLPSYSTWRSNPLRPYDYQCQFEEKCLQHSYGTVDVDEIDHVLIRIVVNYFEKCNSLKIDIPKIEQCISFLKLHASSFTEYSEKYVSSNNISDVTSFIQRNDVNLDVQSNEEEIDLMKKYLHYYQMLQDLDFIKID